MNKEMNVVEAVIGGLSKTEEKMTLKDITDLLGIQHSKAMKIVSKLAESPEFGAVAKLDTVYNEQEQTIETYQLDKRQSMIVSAKLNTKLQEVLRDDKFNF